MLDMFCHIKKRPNSLVLLIFQEQVRSFGSSTCLMFFHKTTVSIQENSVRDSSKIIGYSFFSSTNKLNVAMPFWFPDWLLRLSIYSSYQLPV